MKTLKEKYIKAIYQTRSLLIKEEPFDLHQGGKSHIYLNHRNFLAENKYLDLIARTYLKLIPTELKEFKLCAIDSVMSPIITGAVSELSGKDFVIVKEKQMDHGTKEDIYGIIEGEIVILDDMTSTGKLVSQAAEKIKEKGGTVNYAIVSAIRDENIIENMAKAGITLLYIASFKEILEELGPNLSEIEKKLIEEEYPL